MTFKISKKDFIENLILIGIILQIFIVRWLDYTIFFSYVMVSLLFFHFVKNLKRYTKLLYIWISLCLIIVYVLLNTKFLGMLPNVLSNNLKMILPSIFILPFLSYMFVYKRQLIKKFLLKNIFLFNLYYIINIPIIILELNGMVWLAGMHPSNVSYTLIEDMGSGLLGYYGTPILGLFFAFMTVYNLYYSNHIKNKKNRKIFNIYNSVMFTCMIWLSTQNDNKGAIFIAFVFIGVYTFFTNSSYYNKKLISRLTDISKYFIGVVSGGCLLFLIISKIPSLNSVFVALVARVQEGINLGIKATGSAERIGSLVFILTDVSHKCFGYGIGNFGWRQPNAFGFYNFGQSDLSVLIILGGIVFLFLLLMTLFLVLLFSSKKIFLSVILVLFFVILNIYTQVITEPSSMYIFILFCFVCIQSIGLKHNITRKEGYK